MDCGASCCWQLFSGLQKHSFSGGAFSRSAVSRRSETLEMASSEQWLAIAVTVCKQRTIFLLRSVLQGFPKSSFFVVVLWERKLRIYVVFDFFCTIKTLCSRCDKTWLWVCMRDSSWQQTMTRTSEGMPLLSFWAVGGTRRKYKITLVSLKFFRRHHCSFKNSFLTKWVKASWDSNSYCEQIDSDNGGEPRAALAPHGYVPFCWPDFSSWYGREGNPGFWERVFSNIWDLLLCFRCQWLYMALTQCLYGIGAMSKNVFQP